MWHLIYIWYICAKLNNWITWIFVPSPKQLKYEWILSLNRGISWHFNFTVQLKYEWILSLNREIEMPWNSYFRLSREIKMPRNSYFCLDREIKMPQNEILTYKTAKLKWPRNFHAIKYLFIITFLLIFPLNANSGFMIFSSFETCVKTVTRSRKSM